jgi:hypothetical protein
MFSSRLQRTEKKKKAPQSLQALSPSPIFPTPNKEAGR